MPGCSLAVGGFVAIAATLLACSTASGQGPPTTMVSVVKIRTQPVGKTLELVGSAQPFTRSLVASEVSGVVEELAIEEGDHVEKGEIICRLRAKTRQLELEAAQATLNQLEAELDELRAGTRKEEIAQAHALMKEAEALHEKWQADVKWVTDLIQRDAADPKEYSDTLADAAAAEARRDQAKAAYDLAVAGPRKEEIMRAAFAVEAQRVKVARLQYDLDQTEIAAPFEGDVIRKHTEIGQWMAPGGSVVELIDLEHVLVRVDVPESAIPYVKPGQQVSMDIDALGRTFRGKVKHIIPQADERARTFPIEIELDNRDHVLRSGMFARARVPAGPVEPSLIVPRDATILRGKTHYVMMIAPAQPPQEGTMAMPVPVQLGGDVGDWVAVKSPMLSPEAAVAVKGHDRIYGPQPVQTQTATRIPPPTGAVPASSQPASAAANAELAAHPAE